MTRSKRVRFRVDATRVARFGRDDGELENVIGRKNPLLIAAADQIFGAGGKRLRPVLVLLVARATAALMKLPDINAGTDDRRLRRCCTRRV